MADPGGGRVPRQGEEMAEAHLVRLRGDSRGPLLGVIVTAVILALAVLKPWSGPPDAWRGFESGAPSSRPAGVAASPGAAAKPAATPPATPEATPPGYDAPGGQCYPGADWRLFAVEMRTGHPLRHWLSIEPGAARSPSDPAVPFVRIVTDRVLALGFCVGSGPGGPGPLVGARAWALAPGGRAVPLALAPLVEYMPRQGNLGAVYRPPAASRGGAGAGWSPGRYVFAVRQGTTRSDERWFGVEVVAAPQAPAVAHPSASP